jgi:hypothetical protein
MPCIEKRGYLMAGNASDPVTAFFAKVFEVGGEAVADVRREVVERGWYGRPLDGAENGQQAEPGATPMNWDCMCTLLEKERGHQPEPAQARDPDLER